MTGGAPAARRDQTTVLLATPVVMLVGALAWLAADHGAAHVFHVPVHEDGVRSLAATIFYPRHFLRELPVATLVTLAAARAFLAYGPHVAPPRVDRRFVAAAGALAVAAFVAAAREAGSATAAWDLLQAYTRDDAWQYGSHWRSHLLATAAVIAAAVAASTVLGRALHGAYRSPGAGLSGSLAAFLCSTLLWWPTAEPFTDARVIGHQARETATHVVLTLPLILGVLLARTTLAAGATTSRPPAGAVVALLLGVAIAAGLGVGTLLTGAVAATRPGVRASSLLAAHAFEHVADYVFVALVAAGLTGGRRGASGHAP